METEIREKRRKIYRLILRAIGAAALALAIALRLPSVGSGLRAILECLVFSGTPALAESEMQSSVMTVPLPAAFDPPRTLSAAGQAEMQAEDVAEPSAPAENGGIRIVDYSLAAPTALTMCCMTDHLDPDPTAILAKWEAARARESVQTIATAMTVNPAVEAPLVLILHTHATEAFAPDGATSLAVSAPRSSDRTENMVAVGDVVTEALLKAGIPTVHCRELIDAPDFSAAYTREKAVIAEYLTRYPTIRYIFDVHRDAISRGDDLVRATTTVNGVKTAQIMFVVGTNEKGANHPDWETNLGYALHLQTYLAGKYPGLMRVVNLRGASFNEQYTPHSLLVEIGTAAGSLQEAKAAALLFAEAVAEEILSS